MKPEIPPVAACDEIRPPFMAEFMQQEPIRAVSVVSEPVAVGYVRRMLHAQMRRFDNSDLLRAKRVWTEIFFVIGQILFLLGYEARTFLKILRQHIKNDRKRISRYRFVFVLDRLVWGGIE